MLIEAYSGHLPTGSLQCIHDLRPRLTSKLGYDSFLPHSFDLNLYYWPEGDLLCRNLFPEWRI